MLCKGLKALGSLKGPRVHVTFFAERDLEKSLEVKVVNIFARWITVDYSGEDSARSKKGLSYKDVTSVNNYEALPHGINENTTPIMK